jgi:uncharacterized membrane protein
VNRRLRSLGVFAFVVLVFGLAAGPAGAISLEGAAVNAKVQRDGSLQVSEQITMSDVFHGGYRDIPIVRGQSIDQVAVSEPGHRYRYGGSTELGSIGQPFTFATTHVGDNLRVVWHFDNPSGGPRTFTIFYRFHGLAVAYDDVVDVNLNVWGDTWGESLPSLRATLRLPKPTKSPSYRVWAGPAWVHGAVKRTPAAAVLRASRVPSHQFVDLRVVFPRALLTSTAGVTTHSGTQLAQIMAEETSSYAAYSHDRKQIKRYAHSPYTWLVLILLAFLPSLAVIVFVYLRFGREPKVGYDRSYEQEPPSDLAPALVPALTRERTGAGVNEFTATLFDLIRRGRYKAKHVTTEHSKWGGLRNTTVSDLELTRGKDLESPAPWENSVTDIADPIVGEKGERLSRFRERIASDRSANATRFQSFKSAVSAEICKRSWYRSGLFVLIIAGAVLLLAGALPLFYGVERYRTIAPRFSDAVAIALGICGVVNVVIIACATAAVPLWRARTNTAQLEAERWSAFRRYLTDFPRLKEAPPVSIVLWERYLVYGIAFGIADQVLQAAHLQMPEEMQQQSSLYWIGSGNQFGAGATALAISDLNSGFGSALSPPSSSGSGGGGGFGGGGGGGFGGGGGGGW